MTESSVKSKLLVVVGIILLVLGVLPLSLIGRDLVRIIHFAGDESHVGRYIVGYNIGVTVFDLAWVLVFGAAGFWILRQHLRRKVPRLALILVAVVWFLLGVVSGLAE